MGREGNRREEEGRGEKGIEEKRRERERNCCLCRE
jgi:hypothetical protein